MKRRIDSTTKGLERRRSLSIIIALVLLSGVYVGWSLGANDGANSMGTAVGAGARTVKEAVILVAVFGFLGAVLFGHEVIKTIGRGIVPLDRLPQEMSLFIAVAAMLAAGTWLVVATYLGMPVSTTHSSVGAVAGAGLVAGNVPIDWTRMLDIVISWLATPVGAAILAFLMYHLLQVLLRFISISDQTMKWLLTISGVLVAFSWGANDVANATGVIVGTGLMSSFWASVLGGGAIALGILTWGYRIMDTVGHRITHLAPAMALVAEVASAVNIQLYTYLGIPVSTTHSIVGAIVGVGLVRGYRAIDMKTARDIMLAWTATPVLSAALAAAFYIALKAFIPV